MTERARCRRRRLLRQHLPAPAPLPCPPNLAKPIPLGAPASLQQTPLLSSSSRNSNALPRLPPKTQPFSPPSLNRASERAPNRGRCLAGSAPPNSTSATSLPPCPADFPNGELKRAGKRTPTTTTTCPSRRGAAGCLPAPCHEPGPLASPPSPAGRGQGRGLR